MLRMEHVPHDRYPEVQPPGGWKLKLAETGGFVQGDTFDVFVAKVNDQLRGNGKPVLSWQTIYERVLNAQN